MINTGNYEHATKQPMSEWGNQKKIILRQMKMEAQLPKKSNSKRKVYSDTDLSQETGNCLIKQLNLSHKWIIKRKTMPKVSLRRGNSTTIKLQIDGS